MSYGDTPLTGCPIDSPAGGQTPPGLRDRKKGATDNKQTVGQPNALSRSRGRTWASKSSKATLYKPTSFNPEGPLADPMTYFCHALIMGRIKRKDKSDWTRLSADALRNVLGTQNYPLVKASLIKNRVIECDNSYLAADGNGRCMGYRLCEPYASCPWERKGIRNPRIVDKLKLARQQESKPTTRIDRHLHRYLHKLTIEHY